VRVTKRSGEDHTVAVHEQLDDAGRVEELSRMLSGLPDSATARDHASELLATATRQRSGG
jgi:DNA repair protein RecN (Recombination protein N)